MKNAMLVLVILLVDQGVSAQDAAELPPYVSRIQGNENKHAIPFTFSLMAQLGVFAAKERELSGSGVDHFVTIYRADPAEARTFVAELLTAVDEEAAGRQSAADEFCSREYISAEAYAGAMMMSDTRTEAVMARIVLRVYERTSPELWGRIAKSANDARSGSSMITTDHFELVEQRDYRDALAVQCPGTN